MKRPILPNKTTSLLSGIILLILVLMPFHAFLTVWLASFVGNYTPLRLWKEFLLLILMTGTLHCLICDKALLRRLLTSRLSQLIALYLLIQVVWGIVAYATHHVTVKALAYGWIVDTRFLIFFLVAWVVASKMPTAFSKWPKLVFWPLAAVVLIGLLQYFVLPYDVMKHFGYNRDTIFPYETINHNIQHLRVMSTLRGANPLGAYLVVALSLLAVVWYRQRKLWQTTLFVSGLVVLVLTFSRSAWIAMLMGLLVLGWLSLKSKEAKQRALGLVAGLALLAAILTAAFWHNPSFQDALFHTDEKSTIATSSNQGHVSALKNGVRDIVHEPLGRGPGSAGPASVNIQPARIAENYFVQIGQETGWFGLAVFIAITVVTLQSLWNRRHDSLALGLLAAFIGVTFINLLSHAWTDDTLAYLWWGLAGVALATPRATKHEV